MNASRHGRLFHVVLSIVCAAALAAPISALAQVPECALGKLSDYLTLGPQGCTIGNIHFFHFTYSPAPGGPPASAISVTPGTVPESDDPGLLLEAAWATPSSGSSVSYSVEVGPRDRPISGLSLEMQLGQVTGTGEAKVTAELHPALVAGACGAAQLTLNVVLDATHPKKAVDDGQLKLPERQLCVVTPISLASGKKGSARLQGFMTVFHFSHSQSASAIPPVVSPTGVGQ